MKKKSNKVVKFIDDLHKHIVNNKSFRKRTRGKSEVQIQTEIRPLILDFLKKWFKDSGVIDYENKAHKSFYWEGEEGRDKSKKKNLFGSFNYPDFIIKKPYKIAVEYKQSPNGSVVKQGIGQSIMHTTSGDYDFAYLLIHDQSNGKRVKDSVVNETETGIIDNLWKEYNIRMSVI